MAIEDISDFVASQREHVATGSFDKLLMPEEHVYPVNDLQVARKLGVATWP